MSELDEYLELAKELAQEAGEIMQEHFRRDSSLPEWKSENNPVTVADKAINSLVISKIKNKYPEHGILGEEESYGQDRDMLWVVDPLDGTIPYIVGLPISTFLIALVKEGRPLVALAYNPWINLTYHAQLGSGAFCNGQKLTIEKPITKVVELILWADAPYKEKVPGIRERLEKAGLNPQNFAGGSSRYGIADNRLYGLIFASKDPWDMAVLDLLVHEAGGKITDLDGKTLDLRSSIKGAVAGSIETHKHLMELINA